MSSGPAKSTGVRNIFDVVPVGTVRGNKAKGVSVIYIKPGLEKALIGLDAFRECIVLYLKEHGKVGVHITRIRHVEKKSISVDYSADIEGYIVLDIKPYFPKLDG